MVRRLPWPPPVGPRLSTPGWLLPWLLLSAFRLVPPPSVSTGLLSVALCSGACAVSAILPPNPRPDPQILVTARASPQLVLLLECSASRVGAQARGPPAWPHLVLKGGGGEWSLRPSQDTCPPDLPLASSSLLPRPLSNLPASAGKGFECGPTAPTTSYFPRIWKRLHSVTFYFQREGGHAPLGGSLLRA